MTDRRWRFDGQTAGTTATVGNTLSDTGDPLKMVSAGVGGTVVYDDTWSFPAGGRSLKLTNGTGANQVRAEPAAAHSAGAVDWAFRWAGEVGDTLRHFLRARHASGYIFDLLRTNGGLLRLGSATGGNLATGTVPLPTTAGIRVEVTYDLAAGANSDVTVNAYSTAGALLDTISVANADLGASSYTLANWEVFNSGTAMSLWTDCAGIRDHAATPIGPPELAPVGGVTASRIAAGTTEVDWVPVGDAPDGYTIARASGQHFTGPDEASATLIAEGVAAPPYTNSGLVPGGYTYWVARTAP